MTADDPTDAPSIDRALRLRSMNELIRDRRTDFEGSDVGVHALMCECVDPACTTMLQVTDGDLRHARTDDSWFVVDPRHCDGATIVARANSHCIVQMSS